MIGVISNPLFMNHDTGGYHPETPMRSHSIHALFSDPDPDILMIEPVQADVEDIMLNHGRGYINTIRQSCQASNSTYLDPDTVCSRDSYDTALYAAGSLIKIVQMVLSGEITSGFANVRPPGHHAVQNNAMGFCLFNNVAIAAHKAIKDYGVKRVVIIDFDVHHGNGTQDSFYDRNDVLYFSSHQSPFYPGTGRLNEIGGNGSEGFTVNCPLRGGKNDAEFLAIYRKVLVPIVLEYRPELIIVSAGFDAHAMDPIGGMNISTKGFGALSGLIQDVADDINSPVVYSLEGGYNLEALRDSVESVIDILKGGETPLIQDDPMFPELEEILRMHSRFWTL